MARCPAHEDRRASLAISSDRGGRLLLKCHAGCSTETVAAALGLTMADLMPPKEAPSLQPKPAGKAKREAEYIYRDTGGKPLLKKIKMRYADGSKSFFWQHLDGDLWANGRAGIMPPLYNAAALQGESVAFVVEGEKDCETMTRLGFPCISFPDGAAEKFNPAYAASFADLRVFIIPDNDAPGRAFAETVAEGLAKSAKAIFLLDLCSIWPNMPKKADISDYAVEYGNEAARRGINTLIDSAKPWHRVQPADFSDAGNAETFAKIVKGRLLWCDALGWLVWDGKRWEPNEHKAVGLALDFAQKMLDDALARYKDALKADQGGKVSVPEDVRHYLKHAEKSRGALSIKNTLALSKSYLAIAADKLDADWYLLNTDTGLVDLRSGETRPHDSNALCTRIAPFSPSDEGAAMWEDFIDLITAGDADLKRFLQIKVGSYVFGKIFYEGVDFAVGGGRNGKSTLYNALSAVLGDYAGGIDSTILTTDKQNRGAALATLRGKRLILCGELEEGQRLSVQTLKRIASTDNLTIEEKYRQPETIRPSHHIVLFSNFLPRVGSTDSGTWRRISVIPFNATMPEGDADIPNYADHLVSKAGDAILSWIIEGAVAFHNAGYRVRFPESVRAATAEYMESENWISRFISERCVVDQAARIRGGELYADYKAFAAQTGDYCRRGNDFVKALEGLGYKRQIVHGRTTWIGLRVDDELDYEAPPERRYSGY